MARPLYNPDSARVEVVRLLATGKHPSELRKQFPQLTDYTLRSYSKDSRRCKHQRERYLPMVERHVKMMGEKHPDANMNFNYILKKIRELPLVVWLKIQSPKDAIDVGMQDVVD